MNIENQICEAVEILAGQMLKEAKFDKTIQGTIVTCTNPNKGEYKIKYQDSRIYAYSDGAIYSKGTNVYILVPNGDMTQEKRILGTVKQMGDMTSEEIDIINQYEILGENIIQPNTTEFSICSYKTERKIVSVVIDNDNFNEYITDKTPHTHIMLRATFRTAIDEVQQGSGRYGLRFNFNDGYYFDLPSTKMIGNPYLFVSPIEQTIYCDVSGYDLIQLRSIEFYVENFLYQDSTKPDDIFCSNIQMYAVNKLTENDLSSYYLSVLTPQGSYFKAEDHENLEKTIEAQFKLKGKDLTSSMEGLSFYWFKEDAGAGYRNPNYQSIAGPGWYCVNSYKDVVDADGRHKYSFNSAPIYVVKKSDLLAEEQVYKCVAVFNNQNYSKEVTFRNYGSRYKIQLTSASGVSFIKANQNIEIVCEVYDNGELISGDNIKYTWLVDSNDDYITNAQTLNNTYQLDLGKIVKTGYVKCQVKIDNVNIGTQRLKIYNATEQNEDSRFSLVIDNGSQVFQYSEDGLAPTLDIVMRPPLQLQPLTFTIYDNLTGDVFTSVDNFIVNDSRIKWYIPKDNTMLDIKTTGIDGSDPNYNIISSQQLGFGLRDTYDIRRRNNNIKLEVKWQNEILLAYTNFTIVRNGEVGTNGTSMVCRIVPNTTESEMGIIWPIWKKGVGFNFSRPLNPFKVELWQDGKPYKGELKNIEWSIAKNIYAKNITEESNFSYTSLDFPPPQRFNNFNDVTDDKKKANIVKVKVDDSEGKTYYASVPIVTINMENNEYDIKFDELSGFQFGIYQSDGTKGRNTNDEPFKLAVFHNGIDVSDIVDYNWEAVGGYYEPNGNNWQWIDKPDLKISTNNLPKNQCKVTLPQKISGAITTNALYCTVDYNGTTIGTIHIPIHLYLNRFANSAINGWDGNSVEVSKDGGFILAPQMGAGNKDSNNRFTGVVMGSVKEAGAKDELTGLFGYSHGQQSIFLNAEDGSATFGCATYNDGQGHTSVGGQIIIKPGQEAIIKSGDYVYNKNNGKGMEINFSAPTIKFGSGKFEINEQGVMTASGANINGNFICYLDNNKRSYVKFLEDNNKGEDPAHDTKGVYIKTSNQESNINFELDTKKGVLSFGADADADNINPKAGLKYDFRSGLTLNGNLATNVYKQNTDYYEQEEYNKIGHLKFTSSGIDILYDKEYEEGDNDNVTIEDDLESDLSNARTVFRLTNNKLIMGRATSSIDSIRINSQEGKIDGMVSGLYYNGGSMFLTGTLYANSGRIAGWKIYKDRIASKDEKLILYADGRIVGLYSNEDNSHMNGLYTYDNNEKAILKGGNLNFWRDIKSKGKDGDKDGQKWNREGQIYTRNSDDVEYLGYDWWGSLTVASKGTGKPSILAGGGSIVAAAVPAIVDKGKSGLDYEEGSHIIIPVTERIDRPQTDPEGNPKKDKNGNTIVDKVTVASRKSTRLYPYKVFTRNLTAPKNFFFKTADEEITNSPSEKEENNTLHTTSTQVDEISLTQYLRYVIGHPDKISYIDGDTADDDGITIDTITEEWPFILKPNNKGYLQVITNASETKRNFLIKVYHKGEEDELVKEMVFPDGSVMNLEGF